MQAVVLDGNAANQMFLDDPFEHLLGARMVPDALGPDDRDRTVGADLQAVGLGPLNSARPHQTELLEALLEVLPRPLAGLAPAGPARPRRPAR